MQKDLQIKIRLENGKAQLEFLLPEEILTECPEAGMRVEIWETANGGRPVFYGNYLPGNRDPMTALLLRPHLWNGVRDPYLYQVKAWLRFSTGREVCWQQDLAIYDLCVIEKKGVYLNGAEFCPHIVGYRLPPQISESGTQEEQMERDLERLARMGVNAIQLQGTGAGDIRQDSAEMRSFQNLCRKRGFLTDDLWIRSGNIPVYRGLPGETSQEVLLSADGRTLTERYYYYQAKWSGDPVLYPAFSTLHLQENGRVSLTVYSNQKKVVLYVDGVLFLFQSSQPGDAEFVFEDIPVAKLPLHLAVEAGNLSISLTISKI